jgi:hypothetical protein
MSVFMCPTNCLLASSRHPSNLFIFYFLFFSGTYDLRQIADF